MRRSWPATSTSTGWLPLPASSWTSRSRLGTNGQTICRLAARRGWAVAPNGLTVVAWAYLSVCFACAAGIAYDIALADRRSKRSRRVQPRQASHPVSPAIANVARREANWIRAAAGPAGS